MDKFKSELCMHTMPRGFSVMTVLTENLFKLVEGLQNDATFHNQQCSVALQVSSSLSVHE